VAVYSQ